MAIPKFQDFLYPFLYQLKDKDISSKEMKDALVQHFELTEEDCALKTKSGSAFQLNDRIGWCRQWLRRALFIEIPQRGVYRITQRGKDYLATHTDLRQEDLMEYPEYAAYAGGSPTTQTTTKQDDAKEVEMLTPTDQMDAAFKKINDDLAADLLQQVLGMSPAFFEKLVLDLLLHMGYGGRNKEMARVTPISHDNGIDGVIPEDALGLDKIYIQAKRYVDTPVRRPEIQQFLGALEEQKATKGVFITTSQFTNGAIESASKANKRVVLINGNELAYYMIEYNVGVGKGRVFKVKEIDLNYFEE